MRRAADTILTDVAGICNDGLAGFKRRIWGCGFDRAAEFVAEGYWKGFVCDGVGRLCCWDRNWTCSRIWSAFGDCNMHSNFITSSQPNE